jgi:hypothetical protein
MQAFSTAVNTVAKARLIYVKNKETYKVVIAFNVTETTKNGKYKFPTQKHCAYVSGDLAYETLQADVQRVVETAKKTLKTNNIQFV